MARFRFDNEALRRRAAALREVLADPEFRDRAVAIGLGLGVVLVLGLSIYMLITGR